MHPIWIDLENTPHVPLFLPIKRELENRGFPVLLTARDFAQTIEFLKSRKTQHHAVGKQFSGSRFQKAAGLLWRSMQLYVHLHRYRVRGLLSHGSRSGIIAGAAMGVPIVTMGDYELSNTWLDNRFSSKVMRPEVTDREVLKQSGLDLRKYVPYPGFKEQIYLSDFHPLEQFREIIGIAEDAILVVLRTPATAAHYHDDGSLALMQAVIDHVLRHPNAEIIALPRSNEEKNLISQLAADNAARVHFPKRILDGLNLMWHADLVISGGGTMNREAALLGVPVYSIFTGARGSVDKTLTNQGKLRFASSPEAIKGILITKREIPSQYNPPGRKLIHFIADEVLKTIH